MFACGGMNASRPRLLGIGAAEAAASREVWLGMVPPLRHGTRPAMVEIRAPRSGLKVCCVPPARQHSGAGADRARQAGFTGS